MLATNILLLCWSFLGLAIAQTSNSTCPDYLDYALEYHAPFSSGRYNLSSQRPTEDCRTIRIQDVDDVVSSMETVITDPDLYRLFQNAFPNTLDTAIKWKGISNDSSTLGEELTFVITGDINAMWLRDSANQMQSYMSLLKPSNSSNSLASLYRGVINLQSRYLNTDPYCNSFQPPMESGIAPDVNPSASDDTVVPSYSNASVFECKYELDSLAAFLEVSSNYYNKTSDLSFFANSKSWFKALNATLSVAEAMKTPTYGSDGRVLDSPYTFTRLTTRSTETLANDGIGNPVQNGTGLIRSAFRPSDDSTLFQLFIPSNMMFASYLSSTADIVDQIDPTLGTRMHTMASDLRTAITDHGIVELDSSTSCSGESGPIYAFEIDGYGSRNIMDDANIPSLLSAPFFDYLDQNDEVYQNTRALVLSSRDSYFMRGPVINAVGGPHQGPGMAWPMASIVRIMTTDDEDEIVNEIKQILSSTDGLGLIHESINSFNVSDWTRQWFSWANGLFGQMILDVNDRYPEILKMSFQ